MELEEAYLNPEHPGSFGGINAIHTALKGEISVPDTRIGTCNESSSPSDEPSSILKKRDDSPILGRRVEVRGCPRAPGRRRVNQRKTGRRGLLFLF
ncbi:hypothetical protein AVEN_240139-1 [Araneus ventricosus]|uniref:Uncharacterized protein n=1 Tax=Araneus ventricosus TaxID=182803 RepID=A0A4Y2URP6_ARAVE|nr:hypothetical protein AVEN_240139-1 [Araneus ventricosus]